MHRGLRSGARTAAIAAKLTVMHGPLHREPWDAYPVGFCPINIDLSQILHRLKHQTKEHAKGLG